MTLMEPRQSLSHLGVLPLYIRKTRTLVACTTLSSHERATVSALISFIFASSYAFSSSETFSLGGTLLKALLPFTMPLRRRISDCHYQHVTQDMQHCKLESISYTSIMHHITQGVLLQIRISLCPACIILFKNLLTVVVVKLVLAVCLLLDVAILTSPPIMTLASEKIAPF